MKISNALKNRVTEAMRHRCSYCQMPDELIYGAIEVDHIDPRVKGGLNDESNLCLACSRCNGYKGEQTQGADPETQETVELFNPRSQTWADHFEWSADDRAVIVGKTACARATVQALKINLPASVRFRQLMVKLGFYPPKD